MGAELSAAEKQQQQQKTGKKPDKSRRYLATTQQKRQKKYSSSIADKTTAQGIGGVAAAKKSPNSIKIVAKPVNQQQKQQFGQKELINIKGKIMNSPFRGFRRAATSTSSPISCCSSCSASGTGISIPAFPRTHSTVMVIPGAAKRPVMPPTAASTAYVSPSSSGWTPSTPRPLLLDEDDQNNNANEQLLLHFPNLPPGITNNNEGEPAPTIVTTTEKQSLVSQYGFQTHRPRPPLNRAIPPIPESRSNESIQSAHSRRQSASGGGGIQQQSVRMIDENNPIDEPISKQGEEDEARLRPDSMLIVVETEQKSTTSEGEKEAGKGEKASKLPKFVRHKGRKERGESSGERKQHKEPKSPLLSVAHSVKSRLNRLTHGKSAKSSAANELPMSRSLEIQRQGSRIPQITEPMPKSKSMEEQRELPRRMPATTLIPSPSRRLPPDEELEEERRQKEMIKQVQFAPLPIEEKLPELMRKPEMPFSIWTPEKRILPPEENEIKNEKIDKEEKIIEIIRIEETTIEMPPTPPSLPPPSEEDSLPLSAGHRSPPKVLSLLRKSPQSFPPLGSLNPQPEAQIRPAKSSMSVSFVGGDGKKDGKKEAEIENEKEGKRRVFTTRSLRMVATRVYEGSPLVKRRGRSASRDREKPPKNEPASIGSARLFRKSNSIPEDEEQQKAKKGAKNGPNEKSVAVKLRPVQSVKTVHILRAQAPLAQSESSRVENSPAVEQCPAWEMPSTATAAIRENASTKAPSKRGFLFGATARLCRKDKEEQKKEANKEKKEPNQQKGGKGKAAPLTTNIHQQTSAQSSANVSARPTLAQLLASPVPRKKPAQTETIGKKDKGLIDDEIKDQPMLISTTTLGADFRLIDEPSSSSIHSHPPQNSSKGQQQVHAVQIQTPSSSAPSSVLLVAEQQPATGEISVHMVQHKMQSGLNLAETTSRKRNAPKQNSVETAKIGGGGGAQSAPECKAKKTSTPIDGIGPKEEEMPWADESVKSSDDGMPNVLISEFRSDLTQLRDSVRRDLEELETLRLQNAILKEQLAERDKIIEQLQKQLRGEI